MPKAKPLPIERLALLYSDDSLGILTEGTTVEDATEQCVEADRNERDAAHSTKVVRVRYEVVFESQPTAAADRIRELEAEIAALRAQHPARAA